MDCPYLPAVPRCRYDECGELSTHPRSCSGDTMLKHITIRGGLTFIICLFVALLLTVIGVGYGALKLASDGMRDAQRSSASLASLNASSEKLLQVRLALGSYETLFSVGKATADMLDSAHKK